MLRHLDEQLRQIKSEILVTGGYVERALEEAISALLNNQPERFNLVFDFEKKINEAHIRIDEMCLEFLASQSPVAKDLRLILAIIKINTDLERMGDQAVNISHNARDYLKNTPIKSLNDISDMTRDVQRMIRDALDAFVMNDSSKAESVLLQDDAVDEAKHRVFREFIAEIQKNPQVTGQALDLILIARNLERLGDHATNIAEDVIFAVTGKDIRHGSKTTDR